MQSDLQKMQALIMTGLNTVFFDFFTQSETKFNSPNVLAFHFTVDVIGACASPIT